MDLADGVGELASTPVFFAVDLSLGAFDHRSIALHHGGDVFALVRMDQKHDFVMSQLKLLSVKTSRTRGEVRSNKFSKARRCY